MTVKMNVQLSGSRREEQWELHPSLPGSRNPGEAEQGWVFSWLGAVRHAFPKRSRGHPGLWVSAERQRFYLSIPRPGSWRWERGCAWWGPGSCFLRLSRKSPLSLQALSLCFFLSVSLSPPTEPCVSTLY